MKSASSIFSMQTYKAQSLFGLGGIPEVDQALAAALCSGLKREYYLAARLKYALDYSVARELESMLLRKGLGVSHAKKWRVPENRNYLQQMAGLAVAEMLFPLRYKQDQVRADWVGVSKSQFSRTWKKRYNLIYQILEDWTNCAYSHVMMRQRYDAQNN